MTKIKTNFRLGILIKEFEMIFGVFVGNKGKGNFGCGDKAQFSQSSNWGRVSNGFDALK